MSVDDAQTKVIWRFIGRILSDPSDPDAVDGRDFYYKYADSQGVLRKPAFIEIVTTVSKAMLSRSGALDNLIQSAWDFVSSIRPSISKVETKPVDSTKRPDFLEFRKQVLSKMDDLFVIIAQAFFRFFGKILFEYLNDLRTS